MTNPTENQTIEKEERLPLAEFARHAAVRFVDGYFDRLSQITGKKLKVVKLTREQAASLCADFALALVSVVEADRAKAVK